MTADYYLYYAEANIVCILILSVMLINDRINSTRQETQIWFSRTVIAHILYFASDTVWEAVLGGRIPRTHLTVCLFSLSNLILLSLMTYEWFMYVAAFENMPLRKNRRKRMLLLLPLVLTGLCMMIAYLAVPGFRISESGKLSATHLLLMAAAPLFYLLAAFICSVNNARRTEQRETKKLYLQIGAYPLGVLAFWLIQIFVLNAPVFCFGCTIMMLCFYILHLQTMISVDPLTRLNNRGQINRYMDQVRYRENVRIFVMMIDVDRFKQINDTYGHAEGDRALILVSDSLKKMGQRFRASVFLGRYGGDEFTVFMQSTEEDENPEQAVKVIRSLLAEKQAENRLPYELNISTGYDMLRDKNDTMHACLIRADEKLYEVKRNKGSVR